MSPQWLNGASAVELPVPAIANTAFLKSSPNPFHGSTKISYKLPGAKKQATAGIYDIAGKKIFSFNGLKAAGDLTWNGRNARGSKVPAGIYLMVLKAGDTVLKHRLLIN